MTPDDTPRDPQPLTENEERVADSLAQALPALVSAWDTGDTDNVQLARLITRLVVRTLATRPQWRSALAQAPDWLLENGLPDGVDGYHPRPTSHPRERGLVEPAGDLVGDDLQASGDLVVVPAGDVNHDLEVAAEGGVGVSGHAHTIQPAVSNVNDLAKIVRDVHHIFGDPPTFEMSDWWVRFARSLIAHGVALADREEPHA